MVIADGLDVDDIDEITDGARADDTGKLMSIGRIPQN